MQAGFVLVAILAVVVSVQSAAGQNNAIAEKTLALSKQCAKENNLSEDKSRLAFNQEVPKDEGERCFLECCYRGLDLIQGDKFNLAGAMNVINLRFHTPEEISLATKLVETCNSEVKANNAEKCSLGKAVRECFVKNGKEVDFFPSAL